MPVPIGGVDVPGTCPAHDSMTHVMIACLGNGYMEKGSSCLYHERAGDLCSVTNDP